MKHFRLIIICSVCLLAVMGASYGQARTDVVARALDVAQERITGRGVSDDNPSRLLLAEQEDADDFGTRVFPESWGDDLIPDDIQAMIEEDRGLSQAASSSEEISVPDSRDGLVTHERAQETELPAQGKEIAVAQSAVSVLDRAMIDHLQLKNMEVADVLKLFSEKTGLNIIAGKEVRGAVTIYLKNVLLKDALRIVLDANNLAFQEEDGIIRVMTAAEFEQRYGNVFGGKFDTRMHHLKYARVKDLAPVLEQVKSSSGKIIPDEKSNTIVLIDTPEKVQMMTGLLAEVDLPVDVEVFDLNYSTAEEMVKKIEPLLTEGVGHVKFDARSNKIIVSDVADKIREIGRVVEAFDVQEKQVLIEAKIVQITLTDSYELGVNWRSIFSGLDDLDLTSDFDVISATEANRGKITVGTISNNNYSAMVEALKKIGETNILSSPSITAISNQEARILVGSTQPYVTTTTTTPSSGPTTTAESVNFIEVGVKLYVTPTVHKDGFITMKIRPEVSSVIDILTTSENNDIPIVETSEAETTVRIKDGVTVVIGGLIKDSQSKARNKVPVLGDIPFLGAAFRNRNDSDVKTEVAIFLTPHIISGEDDSSPDSAAFQHGEFLMTK